MTRKQDGRPDRLDPQHAVFCIPWQIVKDALAVDDPRSVEVEDVAVEDKLEAFAVDAGPKAVKHARQLGVRRVGRLAITHPQAGRWFDLAQVDIRYHHRMAHVPLSLKRRLCSRVRGLLRVCSLAVTAKCRLCDGFESSDVAGSR